MPEKRVAKFRGFHDGIVVAWSDGFGTTVLEVTSIDWSPDGGFENPLRPVSITNEPVVYILLEKHNRASNISIRYEISTAQA